MERRQRKYFMLVIGTLVAASAFTIVRGQEFAISKVELAAENINIYYNLKDTVAGHMYTIYVYGSHDNFVNPLTKVRGDLGLQVRPGYNRKIVINAKEELGAGFEGKIGFQVQGKLFVPFITMKNFSDFNSFKRTRKYTVTWSGGTTRNILNFDLYRGDKLRHTFAGIANVGHYDLILPKHIRPGKDYYFKISDSKNKEEVIITESFAVKRKIPLLFKVAGIAAVGVAIKLLIPEETEEIPGAPIPRK